MTATDGVEGNTEIKKINGVKGKNTINIYIYIHVVYKGAILNLSVISF